MYDTTVSVLIHGLKSLAAILKKAEAHCEAKNIKPEALLNFRLFPDMFDFTKQVQLASDFAKGPASRLAGVENPKHPDEEETFAELQARLAKTIAFLESLDRKAFEGAATRDVTFPIGRNETRTMPGAVYFARAALPQFYFHLTTAYNILRHNGIEIGKGDFMGRGL